MRNVVDRDPGLVEVRKFVRICVGEVGPCRRAGSGGADEAHATAVKHVSAVGRASALEVVLAVGLKQRDSVWSVVRLMLMSHSESE